MEITIGCVALIIAFAWSYDFFNGMNDAANAIATSVCTRALSPAAAIALAFTMNVLGAFVTTEVAKTIGKGIVPAEFLTLPILAAALVGAASWSAVCTYAGIPISITHALVAGLMGAGITANGIGCISWDKFLIKVLVPMFVSPFIGFGAGLVIMIAILWLTQHFSPARATRVFRLGQILSAAYVGFAHGTNDTQNAMGVITASLVAAGYLRTFEVPGWVILSCGLMMGLGTAVGGWRVIRTLGMRLVKLHPAQGFSAETSAATVMLGASLMGMPISTTHVIATAVMGVGAVRRLSAVRWGVAGHIVLTWILTFPGAGLIAAVSYGIMRLIAGMFAVQPPV